MLDDPQACKRGVAKRVAILLQDPPEGLLEDRLELVSIKQSQVAELPNVFAVFRGEPAEFGCREVVRIEMKDSEDLPRPIYRVCSLLVAPRNRR